MSSQASPITAVPTNIITGFLGVGKTTAILNLLKSKPANQRWAVLVNEFGEIGVDGSLFEGQQSEQQDVFIREVPGGCMCCAAGLPMQVALNQLLTKAKPDRLLIEPTGLGHPKEVLEVLSEDHYHNVLSLQKILTLVDARKLSESRYTEHDTFNQQIGIADVVVGNKIDLYENSDQDKLINYVNQQGQGHAEVIFAQHGQIDLSTLQGSTQSQPAHSHHHHHKSSSNPLAADMPLPDCGFLSARNEGEGFNSIGWRFSPTKVFNYHKLYLLLSGVCVERMKAVFITDAGVFGYNLTPDGLTEISLDDCLESRIELIAEVLDDTLESELLACLV